MATWTRGKSNQTHKQFFLDRVITRDTDNENVTDFQWYFQSFKKSSSTAISGPSIPRDDLNKIIRKKLAITPKIPGALKSMRVSPSLKQIAAQQDVAKVDLGDIKTLVINELKGKLKNSIGVMLNDIPTDTAQEWMHTLH